MLKVTIKFAVPLIFLGSLAAGCADKKNDNDEDVLLHRADSLSEARIDSAYIAIKDSCDELLVHKVPRFVDSLLKGDTAFMNRFFDSIPLFNDADKKVEKIVRQLQADCDTSLQRETYKKARLLRRPKRVVKGKEGKVGR